MNRRNFTLAGIFGGIGVFIGKALGYNGTDKGDRIVIDDPHYTDPELAKEYAAHSIKVGRKIMQVSPTGDGWNVFTAVKSDQHRGDVLDHMDNDGTPHYYRVPRLEHPPEDLKRWNANGDTATLESTVVVYPRMTDLRNIFERLQGLATDEAMTKTELQTALYFFASDIGNEIKRHHNICDGHHGPAPLSQMTQMPDGRRLCGYCHKQELDDAQLRDGLGGETSTV